MPDASQYRQMLEKIENEMVRLGLWESTSPSAAALSSQQPFCCDTLMFHQWIQFILVPKMTALLDGQQPLPANFSIHPMAEEAFKLLNQDTSRLLGLILEFDHLSASQGPASHG